jgi:cytochrome d ubiquinol oxidase subunit II
MMLPLASAAFAALALTLYVLLDGFDLGVGMMLLLQPDPEFRNHMVDAITPTWDGNETWLIMAGITLLAGFPVAYGVLMPAFYIPLVAMLLSLGLRGVSFEFRYQAVGKRHYWDYVFGIGSLIAAVMQGLMLGGLLQGVRVRGTSYAGTIFGFLGLVPLLCAMALVAGYAVLGCAWLHLKGSGGVDRYGTRALRRLVPIFMATGAADAVGSIVLLPEFGSSVHLHWQILATAASVFLATLIALYWSTQSKREAVPFILGLTAFVEGITALCIIVYPDIVPFRISLWAAASSRMSQIFLLSGAVAVTPVVIAYSGFSYWIFRGKTPLRGWGG